MEPEKKDREIVIPLVFLIVLVIALLAFFVTGILTGDIKFIPIG